jgi:hypothetical protein
MGVQRSQTKRPAFGRRTVFQARLGCAIKGANDSVDFDFGAKGEIDGFDPSRLWAFAAASKKDYGFASAKEIGEAIKKAATEGLIVFSGYMLYFPKKEANQAPAPTRCTRGSS